MRAAALMILWRVTLEGRVGIPGSHFKRLFEHVYPNSWREIKQFECWRDFLYVVAHPITNAAIDAQSLVWPQTDLGGSPGFAGRHVSRSNQLDLPSD